MTSDKDHRKKRKETRIRSLSREPRCGYEAYQPIRPAKERTIAAPDGDNPPDQVMIGLESLVEGLISLDEPPADNQRKREKRKNERKPTRKIGLKRAATTAISPARPAKLRRIFSESPKQCLIR
jgi:hypothetical protein